MRALLMSDPAVIDNLEFARTAQRVSGTIAVTELKRTADYRFDDQGALEYAVIGGRDARNRPLLHIEVRGEIHLCCQRCLRKLPYRLHVVSELPILTTDGTNREECTAEELDGIAANPRTDVLELVEDEVLLALPMVPRHPEGQCDIALRDDAPIVALPVAPAQSKHN